MNNNSAIVPVRTTLLMVLSLLVAISLFDPIQGISQAAPCLNPAGSTATTAPAAPAAYPDPTESAAPAAPSAPSSNPTGSAAPAAPTNPAGSAAQTIPAAAAPNCLTGKVIVLDAGHGGSDPGAVNNKVQEANLTLGITLKLKKSLEDLGAKVVLTREDDSDKELAERTHKSNLVKPTIFVSVHINSCKNPATDGIETYYWTGHSRALARHMFDMLVAVLGVKANFVHQRNLYVCVYADAPSVLVEVGYMSNKEKCAKLATDDYQQLIADALTQGIVRYIASKHPSNKAIKSKEHK